MKVLTINCGSSTLKFRLLEAFPVAPGRERWLARGIVDRIGTGGTLEFTAENGRSLRQPAEVLDHGDAVVRAIGWLGSTGLLEPEGIEAVGHRIVHGGDRFLRREARRRNDSDGKPGPWQDKKGAYGQRLRLGSLPCSLPCSSGA